MSAGVDLFFRYKNGEFLPFLRLELVDLGQIRRGCSVWSDCFLGTNAFKPSFRLFSCSAERHNDPEVTSDDGMKFRRQLDLLAEAPDHGCPIKAMIPFHGEADLQTGAAEMAV